MRRAAGPLMLLAAILALAPSALAATVSGELVHCTGGSECRYFMVPALSVTFDAAPGEVNDVRVLPEERAVDVRSGVRIQDAGETIATGDYCTALSEHDVRCSPRSEEATSALWVEVRTGDEADVAFFEAGAGLLGPGHDTGRGHGVIRGGPGNDDIRAVAPGPTVPYILVVFYGGSGRDVLVGGTPPSDLDGGRGPDLVVGGDSADRLRGRGGDDRITGGRGGDGIVGGRGTDEILAGPDDDRIRVVDGERDMVRCGPGRDRVTVDPLDVVRGCERVRLDTRG